MLFSLWKWISCINSKLWIVGGKFLFLLCNHGINNNDKTFIHQRAYGPFFLGASYFTCLMLWTYYWLYFVRKERAYHHYWLLLLFLFLFFFFFFPPFLVRWWSVILSLLSFPLVMVYLVLEQISNVLFARCLLYTDTGILVPFMFLLDFEIRTSVIISKWKFIYGENDVS